MLHIVVSIVLAAIVAGLWAAIAGWLKAHVGANEVISTIMLNWIAIYVAQYLFQEGGPLQGKQALGNPVSNTIANNMHLPVFWGSPSLQGLDVGIFISLLAAVAFWAIMNRSTLGYEVRAVGHNPEAARYAGISVSRNYVRTMAICGAFAGLAACVDVLGWQFQVSGADITDLPGRLSSASQSRCSGATPRSARSSPRCCSGRSRRGHRRQPRLHLLNPELAPQLTYVIEGLIVLLVSTDLIAIRLLGLPRKLGWGGPTTAEIEDSYRRIRRTDAAEGSDRSRGRWDRHRDTAAGTGASRRALALTRQAVGIARRRPRGHRMDPDAAADQVAARRRRSCSG